MNQSEIATLVGTPRPFEEGLPALCIAELDLREPSPPTEPADVFVASRTTCWACGARSSARFLTPLEVFACGFVHDGSRGAVASLASLGALLERDEAAARERLGVCDDPRCQLRQQCLSPAYRTKWLLGTRRAQGEIPSARLGQNLTIQQNAALLHMVSMSTPRAHLRAMFECLLSNSAWVQERCQKFQATARSVIGNQLFSFVFEDEPAAIRVLSRLPHVYCRVVLWQHITSPMRSRARWFSRLRAILETGTPRVGDALYAMAVVQTIKQCAKGPDGEPQFYVHSEAAAESFKPTAFGAAIKACVDSLPEHWVHAQDPDQERCAPPKRVRASHGVPTCSSLAAESIVKTNDRYYGAMRGLGLGATETEEMLLCFLESLPAGNGRGHEKCLDGTGKTCTVVSLPRVRALSQGGTAARKRLLSSEVVCVQRRKF